MGPGQLNYQLSSSTRLVLVHTFGVHHDCHIVLVVDHSIVRVVLNNIQF